MRNRKWIVFGGGVAAAMLAVSGSTARAEDFCDTWSVVNSNMQQTEELVRKKCKVGDIIVVSEERQVGRLCDIHQPVVSNGRSGAVCFLAPPRKTY